LAVVRPSSSKIITQYTKHKNSNEQINIVRFRTQATNTSTTTNYTNIAHDLLPYNMASATLTIESNNSKRRRCRL